VGNDAYLARHSAICALARYAAPKCPRCTSQEEELIRLRHWPIELAKVTALGREATPEETADHYADMLNHCWSRNNQLAAVRDELVKGNNSEVEKTRLKHLRKALSIAESGLKERTDHANRAELVRLRQQVSESHASLQSAANVCSQQTGENVRLLSILAQIASGTAAECGCDHSDENCCNLVGEFCPHCIAEAALAEGQK